MICPRTQEECFNLECGKTTNICGVPYYPSIPGNFNPDGSVAVPIIAQETEESQEDLINDFIRTVLIYKSAEYSKEKTIVALKSKFTIKRKQ